MEENKYIIDFHKKTDPALKLFCFPHAGSGASFFAHWQDNTRRDIEVIGIQLPGRENRAGELPITDFSLVISKLEDNLIPYMDKTFAFFGHSMGAYICFELARVIMNNYNKEPLCLYLSGAAPPHKLNHKTLLHKTDKEHFFTIIQSYEGIPAALLEKPELLTFYLPLLRADITLIEKYKYIPSRLLHCPIIVFGGRNDKLVDAGSLPDWQKLTTGLFQCHLFDGGHFFINEHRNEILKIIDDFIP